MIHANDIAVVSSGIHVDGRNARHVAQLLEQAEASHAEIFRRQTREVHQVQPLQRVYAQSVQFRALRLGKKPAEQLVGAFGVMR